MRAFWSRFTYANVMATIAVFLALGGGALAAVALKKNSVKSKQIKDGQVKAPDLAKGAVTGDKLADGAVSKAKLGFDPATVIGDNSITGTQVDESTLQGVNAAKLGGVEVKKVNFQVPFGTAAQTVLAYPGIFRMDASCQNSGDIIDVAAFTGVNNSEISEIASFSGNSASDIDAQRDIVSRADTNLDTGEAFEVDNDTELTSSYWSGTIQFSTPDGFASTTQLQSWVGASGGCRLTGYSIGG
jgi:hypothetical protein